MKFCILVAAIASVFGAVSATVTNHEEALLQIFPDIKTNGVLKPPGISENNSTIVVAVNMHILDIHQVDDDDQEFSVSMYIRQRWTDSRLKFTTANPNITHVVLHDREKLWVPDTFFVNERKTKFGDALTENSFIKIYSDGKVIYSTRVHTKLSCKMDHSKFPFDKQTCSLVLESYAHTKEEVSYEWYEGDGEYPVSVSKSLTVRPFDLEGYGASDCSVKFKFVDYNCLKVEFLLARRGFGRYLMQVYLPIGITVAVTYLTLWLHVGWPTKVFLSGVGMMSTSILAAFASTLGPATQFCTALDAWGFWSVILSSLPMAVLVMSRLLTPKVQQDDEEKKEVNAANSMMSLTHADTRIEKVAIFMIPLIFVLFNFIYWVNYAERITIENSLSADRKMAY